MKDLYYFDSDEPIKSCNIKVIKTKIIPKSTYKDRNDVDEKVTDKKFTKEEWENFVSFITREGTDDL